MDRYFQNLIVTESLRCPEVAAIDLNPFQRIRAAFKKRMCPRVVRGSVWIGDAAEYGGVGRSAPTYAFLRLVLSFEVSCVGGFFLARAGSSLRPSYAARRLRATRSAMRCRTTLWFTLRF